MDPTQHDGLPARVAALHRRLDAEIAPVAARHLGRLACRRGCSGCCRDDLAVGPAEAALIRARHAAFLVHRRPAPPGRCAFLDAEGACRIYAERPYVCRTQGLPLAWFEETSDEDLVERRDICPENAGVGPLERLPVAAVWQIGPYEIALDRLAREAGLPGDRIPLRALFAAPSSEEV